MAYTTINDPTNYFQVKTWTGTASSNALTFGGGTAMAPDLVWIKNRDYAYDHHWYDKIRGVQKALQSNTTEGENTKTTGLTAFDSDGFTVGADNGVNKSGDDIVAWCWKAGGAGSSNTDGSITSTVSANTAAGFSIVKYTGTGSAATVGHGLGKKPDIIFTKLLATQQWFTYNRIRSDASKAVFLDTDAAESSQGNAYAAEASTSVISYGTDGAVNGNGVDHIAYCFTSIPGFSQIGHYKGNGDANGQYITTGFKPAWTIGHKDVDQQREGIITSSPSLNLYKCLETKIDNKFADEPELTITAYLDPIYLANSFSNFFVIFDIVNCCLLITSLAIEISDLLNAFSKRG